MIQLISVTKNYTADITALDDVTIEIQEGEFVFLVGPSGSGKTTLIKMLIREELPSVGKIYFEDEDITKFKRKQVYALRRKIGVIFQDYKLIPELDAFENVAFAMEAAGKSDAEIKENVPYLLDIVGLSNRMDFFPKQLSGGEQQRVAIARAMANNPKLLIADEPTGNLDPNSAWDIVQILSKINNWGTTVIMSTHGSDIVNSLHKRVLRMQDGKIVRDDYRGSYDEVDEFSLRVLNSSNDKIKQQKDHAAPPPPEHKDAVQEPAKTEKTESEAEEKPEKKQIKFSTKKKPEHKEQTKAMEAKILEKISKDDENAKKS
jgi:cell division transport system ATP-binding protein